MTHSHLTAAEIARERQWRLRAWVMLVLRRDEMAAILQSPMPPTIAELVALARKRAAEQADRCTICGHPVPIDPVRRLKKPQKPGKKAKSSYA